MQIRRIPVPPAAALALLLAAFAVIVAPAPVSAHAPSVVRSGNESPATAHVIEDPALSRAIGATLGGPGETDWYRMDLRAGDAIVVEVTAPDAVGGIATSFALLGPGLPPPASEAAAALAQAAGADGAIEHEAIGGEREVHGGLGFIAWGGIRSSAPADGTYWIAVRAAEDGATGKYVLAPGVREEFGLDAIGGMADLVAFFSDPWPPEPGAPPTTAGAGGASRMAAIVGGLGAAVLLGVVGSIAIRRRRTRARA
jgi:hypothetical protein